MRHWTLFIVGMVLFLTGGKAQWIGAGTVAHADEKTAAIEKINELHTQAMAEYDNLEFATARRLLLSALKRAKGAQIEEGDVYAQVCVGLGIVYTSGFGNRKRGSAYFEDAIRAYPSVALDPARATPDLVALFEEVKLRVGPVKPDLPPTETVAKEPHTQPSRIETVETDPETSSRNPVEEPERQDEIPEPKTSSGSDRRGKFTVTALAGTGFGLLVNAKSEHSHPQVNNVGPVDVESGLALAPFHVGAELGYFFTQHFHLSAMVRLQLVNALDLPSTIPQGSSLSVLALAKAKWFFGGRTFIHFVSLVAGGGTIRHRVPLKFKSAEGETESTTQSLVDSRKSEMVAFGPGGGFGIRFTSHLAWIIEPTLILLVPNIAVHVDVNTGLMVIF